jgi:hypothetical protein
VTPRPTAALTAPGPRARPVRSLFWLLGIVVVIAAVVSAALVLVGQLDRDYRGASTVSRAEAAFARLVSDQASAGQLELAAVDRSCQEAAPGAPARAVLLGDLSRAVALRQSVLRALRADTVEFLALPDGQLLTGDLAVAMKTGLTVDEDDQGWLQDLQATGCYSAPANDIHYRAASVAAMPAAAADRRLTAAWAAVDPGAGGAHA